MPLPRCLRAFATSMCLAGLVASVPAQPVAVHPDPTHSLSLNGTWDFAYRAGPAAEHAPVEFSPIAVPGHWELQGFAEPKYGKELAEGNGYYRLTFPVPMAWAGQRVMLRFDGVLSGFTAAVNSKPIGEWASGYNPATFDITDLLLAGGRKRTHAHRHDPQPRLGVRYQ
jgi:beta-galactosidase/beta-glucuronidase